jgi:hypothetical protein
MPRNRILPERVYEFPGAIGLDLKDSLTRIPPQYARKANFIDVGVLGSIKKADGPIKINGTQITSNPRVTGMIEFNQNDATKSFIVYTSDGKLHKINYSTGVVTDITPTNPTVAPDITPYFYIYANLCIFSDGVNPPLYIYDGVVSDDSYELGVKAPTAALGVAKSSTGLTGTFKYKYTFVSDTGAESNASPASTEITVADEQVDLSNIAINSDVKQNVVKRWIYRTVNGGAVYYFLHELDDNSTTIWTDTLNDESLGERLVEENEVPLAGTTGFTEYNGSLYAFVKNGFNLVYTNPLTAEAFGAFNTEPISPGDGQAITALGRLNHLTVFKKKSMHAWIGLPGLFARKQVTSGIGCIAQNSVQNVDLPTGGDVLFFLSQHGIHMYDEQDAYPIARELEPIFTNKDPNYKFNHNFADKCHATYSYNTKKYMLACPINGASENNALIIFDAWANSWHIREPFYCGSLTLRTNATTAIEEISGGESRDDVTDGGFTFVVEDGESYLGGNFKGEYVTAWNDLEHRHEKLARFLELDLITQGDFPLIVAIYVDGEDSPSFTENVSLSVGSDVWDDIDTLWDQATYAGDTFTTVEIGLKRIQFRYISIGFSTENSGEPWEILKTRIRYIPLPAAGDRK